MSIPGRNRAVKLHVLYVFAACMRNYAELGEAVKEKADRKGVKKLLVPLRHEFMFDTEDLCIFPKLRSLKCLSTSLNMLQPPLVGSGLHDSCPQGPAGEM